MLCEKPLTRHPDEVDAAFDAADRAGRLLSEAFMYRHNPQTKRCGSWSTRARSASCGSSARRSATRSTTRTTSASAPSVDGGALMDVGCYCVSGSRLFGGEPESVFGQAWYGPSGTDWVFAGTLRFPGDVLATLRLRHRDAESRRARGDRQRGLALPRRPVARNVPVIERRADGKVERIELEPVDSYRLELENVSDATSGDGEAAARTRRRGRAGSGARRAPRARRSTASRVSL